MKKVVLNFIRLSVVLKIAFYRSVLNNMTDNEHFPSPDVSLADVKAAVDKLAASEQAARDGGKTALATRNADEVVVDDLFRLLAAYVDRATAGDEVAIISSGFQIAKQTTTRYRPALQALDGAHSGSVKLMAKAIERAAAYIWQYAKDNIPDNEAAWTVIANSTKASCEIEGLSVACRYYFRVAAITPSGTTDFTAPVMKIVI